MDLIDKDFFKCHRICYRHADEQLKIIRSVKLQDCMPPFQELLSLKVDDELFGQLESKQKKERILLMTYLLQVIINYFRKNLVILPLLKDGLNPQQ